MTDELTDSALGLVAVVGMAGRFPGAGDLDRFWANVVAGRHAMRDLTDDELRASGVDSGWLDHPGYVKTAAVLDDADRFDAGLFDISPREAALMDPQHRVFLETCWEALEHAGRLTPYGGSSVGVFGGAGGVLAGYLPDVLGTGGRFADSTASLEHLGNDKDFLATRVSYKLGLTGPGLTVQTACSTSLVAVHLACQSLLLGECDTAVAGGVTVRVPSLAGYLHQDQGILSPDGRCRPFDAAARGTVFGSGAGAVVLRPLSAALRDRDTVYAVIRGTAVNNDGGDKTSYGASTVDGQLAAMRQALTVAEIPPATIGYVEAHGTGTLLGDPLEVTAIRRALGDGAACAVGSVKALVGHLEAAAGIAGLIKTVQALHHGVIPPSPHVSELNPRLRLDGSALYINREPVPWGSGPRRAAVNSLGIGGTNAFAVLEQAPVPAAETSAALPREVITVSAKTDESLDAAVGRWAGRLRSADDGELADLAHTSQVGRRRLPRRVSVLAATPGEAADELTAWLERRPGKAVRATRTSAPRIAFLFSGQGGQYPAMAAELHERHGGFRDSVDRRAALFHELTGVHPRDALCDRDPAPGLLNRAEILQPALFLFQIALFELWTSWGVRPHAVAGHSLGEYAAACAAGVFTAEDGLRLVAERGAVIAGAAAPGGMIAVRCPDAGQLRELIRPHGDDLAVGGHNAPELFSLSGTAEALAQVRARCRELRWAVVELDVTHAFHSPLMAPAAEALREAAGRIPHHPPRLPFVISGPADSGARPGAVDGDYWARQLVSTVRFNDTLDTLHADGVTTFLEIGPGNALTGFGRARRAADTSWLPGPDSRRSAWVTLQQSLVQLDADGARVDWEAFQAPLNRRRTTAPTYPFARERHWIGDGGSTAPRASAPRAAARSLPAGDLTALRRIALPGSPQRRWESGADTRAPEFLGDHVLLGRIVVPGAYHTACLLEAYAGRRPVLVEDLVFPRALVLDDEPGSLQIVLDEARDGVSDARVLGLRPGAPAHADSAWTVHAQGRVSLAPDDGPGTDGGRNTTAAPETGPDTWTRSVPGTELYEHLDRLAYGLGPAFRWIRELRLRDDRVEADVRVPDFLDPAGRPARTVLIDVCVQTAIGVSVLGMNALDGLLLPFRADRAVFRPVDRVPRTARVRATVRSTADPTATDPSALLDVRIEDTEGRPLVELTGLELRRVAPHLVTGTGAPATVHNQSWQPLDGTADGASRAGTGDPLPERWLVLGDRQGRWKSAVTALEARGAHCAVLLDGAAETIEDPTRTVLSVTDPADPEAVAAALSRWSAGGPEGDPAAGPLGVLHCLGLDLTGAEPDAVLLRRALGAVPALLQALDRRGWAPPALLALVTAGAVAADGPASAPHPQQFTLWGAGRGAVHELPDTDVRLVDTDPGGSLEPLAEVLARPAAEASETVLRAGRILVPRLGNRRTTAGEEFTARPDGSYLITGGLGALGLDTARWLAGHGARHLVLAGRGAPGEEALRTLTELENAGTRCLVVAADIAEPADTDRLMKEIRNAGAPLRGVFHAAGVVEDAMLSGLRWDAFDRVLAAKTAGAWNLHRATLDEDLDHFVLYSSTAALLGSAGQAHYAAGNAFLDALAHHRAGRGLPALSIGWGPVTAGMTARLDRRHRDRMAAAGFTLIDPRRVLTALGRLLAEGTHDPAHGVFELDWETHLARFPPDRRPANRPRTAAAPATRRPADAPSPVELLREWDTSGEPRRRELTTAYLARTLTHRVGVDTAALDGAASLTALGVDSMIAIEIRGQVRADVGVDLPLSLLLEDEPVSRVEDALHAELARVRPAGSPAAADAHTAPPADHAGRLTAEAAGELLATLHHLDSAGLAAVAALLAVPEMEG
ncbi:type I polyketide synthase [Streptomyces niveus]|uniref:type I polyketide synthase n=1 Tax=Streptomyces niveus TaxID=193462 RepID=UPI0033C7809D